jgi:putative PIN family toxin of toxin-antitoxin system
MFWGGKPAEVIRAAQNNKATIFASEEIVAEISRVLAYPKFRQIYHEKVRIEDLMEIVLIISKIVKVTKRINVVKEHPADDKFVECAYAAGADFIVSGDKHLLRMARYKKIRIITAAEFLQAADLSL